MASSRRLTKSKEFQQVENEIKEKSENVFFLLKSLRLKKTELNKLMTTSVRYNNLIVFKFFVEELKFNPLLRNGELLEISVNMEYDDFFDYFMSLKEIENNFILHSICYNLVSNGQEKYIKKAFKFCTFRRVLSSLNPLLFKELNSKKKIKENLVSF